MGSGGASYQHPGKGVLAHAHLPQAALAKFPPERGFPLRLLMGSRSARRVRAENRPVRSAESEAMQSV